MTKILFPDDLRNGPAAHGPAAAAPDVTMGKHDFQDASVATVKTQSTRHARTATHGRHLMDIDASWLPHNAKFHQNKQILSTSHLQQDTYMPLFGFAEALRVEAKRSLARLPAAKANKSGIVPRAEWRTAEAGMSALADRLVMGFVKARNRRFQRQIVRKLRNDALEALMKLVATWLGPPANSKPLTNKKWNGSYDMGDKFWKDLREAKEWGRAEHGNTMDDPWENHAHYEDNENDGQTYERMAG